MMFDVRCIVIMLLMMCADWIYVCQMCAIKSISIITLAANNSANVFDTVLLIMFVALKITAVNNEACMYVLTNSAWPYVAAQFCFLSFLLISAARHLALVPPPPLYHFSLFIYHCNFLSVTNVPIFRARLICVIFNRIFPPFFSFLFCCRCRLQLSNMNPALIWITCANWTLTQKCRSSAWPELVSFPSTPRLKPICNTLECTKTTANIVQFIPIPSI